MNTQSKGNREKDKEKDKDKDKDKTLELKKLLIPPNSYNYNISDIIAKNMFEKMLSLSITKSEQNKIEKKIPIFCFDEIKESLELTIYIDFLNHDKDDKKKKPNILNFKSKSQNNLNFKYENINKSFHRISNLDKNIQDKILIKNKSEKLKKYKFHRNLDPNVSNEGSINLDVFKSPKKKKEKEKKDRHKRQEKEKEKNEKLNKNLLLHGLIIRDKSFDNKNRSIKNDEETILNKNHIENEEPFVVNSPEEIGNIQKLESHKIDYNVKFYTIFKNNPSPNENKLKFDTIMTGENHWGMISQPSAPSIDRDAGTKIKYEKPVFKLKKDKNGIKEVLHDKEAPTLDKNKQQKDINEIDKPKNKKSKRKPLLSMDNYNNEQNKKKKKFMPIIEFPSEDIDPKLFGRETENEEIQKLRDDLEKGMIEKKIELANKIKKEKEEQALEKAREEKRKELANKNVTVDIKGELVYIKSLDINQFINDFTKTKSKFKEVKTIEFESKIKRNKRRQSTIIEKNPDVYMDFQEQEKISKKKSKNNKSLPNISGKKSFAEKGMQDKISNTGFGFIFDKNKEPIIGSGSNFDIMSPACGVNLTEENKIKSGGKDFFHKYNKYSIQVFEETLNRTISANFYQNKIENFINNTTSTNVMSLKKRRKSVVKEIINESSKEKSQENKNKANNTTNIDPIVPNESNRKIILKTKNLKMALTNLDLITEGEEKYLSKQNHPKNKNVIKRKQFIIDFNKQEQKDYNEIDKFAKTLVGSENWGDNIYNKSNIKRDFRRPRKPAMEILKREVPENILNHLPRKRLPPINVINRLKENNFGKTMSDGFFNKNKKNRLKPLSTEENKNMQIDEDEENKNKKDDKKIDPNFSTTSNFYKNTIN